MRPVRRMTAAAVVAGVGFAAGGASLVRVMPVFASNNCAPYVGGISPQHGAPGQTITITGDNFNCLGSLSVSVGNWQSPPIGATTGNTIQVTPPGAQYGVITVTGTPGSLQFGQGSGGSSSATFVYVTDPSNVAPQGTWSKPTTGVSLSGTGSGLPLGGQSLFLKVHYATSQGNCPSDVTIGSSNTGFSFSGPGQYCAGTVTVSDWAWTDANHSSFITIPLPTLTQQISVQPSVTSPPGVTVAGSAAEVAGTGFGTSGSATLGGAAVPSSWTDRNISVSIPDTAASGDQLVVTRADNVQVFSGPLTVAAHADSASPSTASIGDTVTVNGGGFEASPGSVTLSGVSVAPSSWSPTSITFKVPANAQGGGVQVTPAHNNAPANAPALSIQAKLSGVSPTHVTPNSYVQINGSGFGTSKGTVTVGGYSVPVTVWGDSQIVILIPSGSQAGSYPLSVTPPGQNTVSSSLIIDKVPASSQLVNASGGSSSSSSGSSSSSASASKTPGAGIPPLVNGLILPGANGPIIAHGPVNFTKPPKPASPVNLTLSTAADNADPGQDVPFTVTLIAFGKPVAGATVDLTMVVVPGTDAKITPTRAVTDAQGRVSGVVHLSKTAGDHIILAKSGTTSDEVRLVGRGAATSDSGSGGITSVTDVFTAGPSKMLLIVASAGCLVLFLTGFAIQMILPRRSRALVAQPATGGSYVVARRRRSLLGRIVRVPQAVAVLTQYAVLALIVVPAQLVARVHR